MASVLLEEHEDLASNLGVNAVVDQIHSSAVDLMGGTGMGRGARTCGSCKRPPEAPPDIPLGRARTSPPRDRPQKSRVRHERPGVLT